MWLKKSVLMRCFYAKFGIFQQRNSFQALHEKLQINARIHKNKCKEQATKNEQRPQGFIFEPRLFNIYTNNSYIY